MRFTATKVHRCAYNDAVFGIFIINMKWAQNENGVNLLICYVYNFFQFLPTFNTGTEGSS